MPVQIKDQSGSTINTIVGSLDFAQAMYPDHVCVEIPDQTPGPVIPQSVTAFQAKAALLQADLLDEVEALMADVDTPRIVKLAWSEALTFERQSPTVLTLATALGLSSAELDELFVAASEITA
jgi:hypothetical protein